MNHQYSKLQVLILKLIYNVERLLWYNIPLIKYLVKHKVEINEEVMVETLLFQTMLRLQ